MISGNLEYLICSLPDLKFTDNRELQIRIKTIFNKYASEPKDITDLVEIFVQETRKYLSENNFRKLKKLTLDSIHDEEFQHDKNRTIFTFAQFMYALKKAINLYRINETDHRYTSAKILAPLNLESGNPLEVEIRMMELQWNQLEDLSLNHHFDLDILLIYKLKLQILIRWWNFSSEKGMNIFNLTTKHDDH